MSKVDAWKDQLKGDYTIVKGKLKQEYALLTEDDLQYEEGKEDEFLGRIQKKLGKSREELHEWFDRTF